MKFLNKYNTLVDEEKERRKAEQKLKAMNRKFKHNKKGGKSAFSDKVLND